MTEQRSDRKTQNQDQSLPHTTVPGRTPPTVGSTHAYVDALSTVVWRLMKPALSLMVIGSYICFKWRDVPVDGLHELVLIIVGFWFGHSYANGKNGKDH